MMEILSGRKAVYCIAFVGLIMVLFTRCRKENFIDDPSAMVSFSKDTIMFDTVFTTLGSTTQVFTVRNTHNESIRISSIALEGGSASQFRIAVDGINGIHHENIEILPDDSIFVFVEVTVDPGNVNDPFVLEDHIIFITNGNIQEVTLVAWGQDAYFHGGIGGIHVLPCPSQVWNNDKPHIIYGILAVDSSCSLTIMPGTQVYVHAKSGLYIYKGSLFSGLPEDGGNASNRVVFQGDRLEAEYENVPGQWGIQVDYFVETGFSVEVASVVRGGIWIVQSPGSRIENTVLKNGTIGLQVDTSATSGFDVILKNVIISNMSAIGLLTREAHVSGENILVNNCGQVCAAFTIGGKYDFRHCTFANYWQEGNRTAPSFLLNDYYEASDQTIVVRNLEQADFYNCIMWGNNYDLDDFSEFVIDLENEETQQYFFQSCIVDTEIDVDSDPHFSEMSSLTPSFVSPYSGDFHISQSACQSGSSMIGIPVPALPTDLDDVLKSNQVNIGCYECPE